MKRVSVVVVTHDHADEIDACLDAALAQAADGLQIEVVVADNASTDATPQRLRARGDAVEVLERVNDGFSAGVNAAFDRCTGELVLLLNPDCVMEPGCVATLAAHLDAHPDVGVAAALLHDPDGSLQLFARRDSFIGPCILAFTDVGRRVDARLLGGRSRLRRQYAELWPPATPVVVDVPAAACVLVRHADVAPRPLDGTFPLFFNDADMCRRLRLRGRRAEVVPTAHAVHAAGTSVARAGQARPAAMRAEWIRSLRLYTARHWSHPPHLLLGALLIADGFLGLALAKLGRGNVDFARGTLGGMRMPGGEPPLLSRPS